MNLALAPWFWPLTLLRGALIVAACGPFPCGQALARQATGVDQLSAQATDPTASLMSFQLNDWYTANFRGTSGSANQVVFRMAIPLMLADTPNIFRVTQPYVTSSPSGATGFTDTTVFDLVDFAGHKWRPNFEAGYDLKNDFGNQRWVLGAAIVLLLPT